MVINTNMKWLTLFMKASGEEYRKWESMMNETLASYNYSQEKKIEVALEIF